MKNEKYTLIEIDSQIRKDLNKIKERFPNQQPIDKIMEAISVMNYKIIRTLAETGEIALSSQKLAAGCSEICDYMDSLNN